MVHNEDVTKSTDSLGPLPTADQKGTLERQSLSALRARLPPDRFLIRDEQVDDYGVDLSIEVLVAGKATNCRAQVQVKARSGLRANMDGSFSVSVDVSNINYLMNGPCPVYVLYRPESNSVLFTFAQDEFRRLREENPAWADRSTFTIRFGTELNEHHHNAFAERVLTEAQRHRELRDAVAVATPTARHRFEVTSGVENKSVLSADQAEQALLQHGLSLVSRGLTGRVFELLALVPRPLIQKSGILMLVQGSAEFATGHYIAAQASIREASASPTGLEDEELQFLSYLRYAVDYALGELAPDEFRARCDEWRATAPRYLSLQYELARLWSLHADLGEVEGGDLIGELSRVVRQLGELSDAPGALVQQARLLEIFMRAGSSAGELLQAASLANQPSAWWLAYDKQPSEVIRTALQRTLAWRDSMNKLLPEIREAGNPILYCNSVHARDTTEVFVLSQVRMAAIILGRTPPPIPGELFEQLRQTQNLARRFDQPELELRSRLLESDLADIGGNRDRAVALAEQVRELADTLRYATVSRAAQRIVARSDHQEMMKTMSQVKEAGMGGIIAEMSDQDVEGWASHAMELFRVPDERLPLVRDEMRAHRALAQAKRDWCGHIELIQDPAQGTSETTLWATRPQWIAGCALLCRRSAIASEQWSKVMDSFRGANCAGCAHRQALRWSQSS